MPCAVRSTDHPRGLPGLPDDLAAKVKAANTLIDNSARILNGAARMGIRAGEENPHTSILWCFPSRKRLLARWAAPYVDFCSGGCPARKRARLSSCIVGHQKQTPYTADTTMGSASSLAADTWS